MSYTVTERTILANQYLILKALYPEDARYYDEAYDVVMRGYERHYIPQGMYTGDSVMTGEECDEVISILNMYRAMIFSYHDLQDQQGVDPYDITFQGFDGNDETEGKYMAYAKFFCNHDGGRFEEIDRSRGYNSHSPKLERYRTMLALWESMGRPHRLSKEQILRIVQD